MKQSPTRPHWARTITILLLLWGLSAIADRAWFLADRSVPGWDQADYLSASLTYLQGLQQPQWGSGNWWTEFWQLRSKIPPLTYISAALVQMVAGTGPDEAAIVLSLFTGVLLASVFLIGAVLFGPQIGIWAAALCLLLPGFYRFRLDFLLDYPLTAMVIASFAALTLWRSTDRSLRHERSQSTDSSLPSSRPSFTKNLRSSLWEWLTALAFGVSLGLALLTKQPALFFLGVAHRLVGDRGCGAAILGTVIAACGGLRTLGRNLGGPWYRANWFLMLTAGKRATIDSAAIEGDPALNTWAAWTFYLEQFPRFVSWPLLVVPIVGLVVLGGWWLLQRRSLRGGDRARWLAVFLVGGYLLSSLNVNKDARYILPLLPVVAVVLAAGLVAWGQRGWGRSIRWGTAVAGLLLLAFNLLPLGIQTGPGLGWPHYPYMGPEWPHAEVVQSILDTEPHLQANVGVLPSTQSVNQHNVGYFGALRNKQVFGRQVGTRESFLEQDGRSLPWFLTTTGDPGSVPSTHGEMKRIVEEGGDFERFESWELPRNEGTLQLFRQKSPAVVVESIAMTSPSTMSTSAIARTAPNLDLSVVAPIYNEVESVPKLIDAIAQAVAPSGLSYEIICVDDGSKDGSAELLRDLAATRQDLCAVLLRRNYGQTPAMAAGFNQARGKVIVTLDGDLQNDPRDIPKLLAKLNEGYDLVSGWRKNRKDATLTRTLPSKIANWLIGRTTGVRLHDYGCSLKAYRAELVADMNLYGELHRFLPALAYIEGARITEIPVNHFARQFGQSKYGLGRTFRVIMDLFTIFFIKRFLTRPMHVFGGLGISFLLLGTADLMYLGIVKLIVGQDIGTRPLLILAIVLVLGGIQLLSFGLLAELLMRTYHESQDRPIYRVREVVSSSASRVPQRH